MTIRVGINGFGRKGRLIMRAAYDWPDIDFVHTNEPAGDTQSLAHLLTSDSVHGRWHHAGQAQANQLQIDAHRIATSRNETLVATDWSGCKATTVEQVNALLQSDAEGELKGILGFETRPLVSTDYCGDPRSSIVDAESTMVVNGTQVKIYAWYDNEWGYANRSADILRLVGARVTRL